MATPAGPHLLRPLHFLRRFSRLTGPPRRIATRRSADGGGGEFLHNRRSPSHPSSLPWKKQLANTVHLIGTVVAPVQIKHLVSGKVFALTRLDVKNSPTDVTRISLSLWDELALVASHYVNEGQRIYVRGRLVSDSVENRSQVFYKVVVQELNFIERSSQPVSQSDANSNFKSWSKMGRDNQYCSVEQLWQAFFANPLEWWDNRNDKRNPKAPDFKHKDTGEVLWIEDRCKPSWVKSQLAILDSRMGSMRMNQTGRRLSLMSYDETFWA